MDGVVQRLWRWEALLLFPPPRSRICRMEGLLSLRWIVAGTRPAVHTFAMCADQ